jgi:hypothetical protein
MTVADLEVKILKLDPKERARGLLVTLTPGQETRPT